MTVTRLPLLHLLQIEAAALGRIMTALDSNKPARSVQLTDEEAAAVRGLYMLTMKPMIYAANVPEGDMADVGAANKHVQTMRARAAKDSCELIIVSAQVGLQLAALQSSEVACCFCLYSICIVLKPVLPTIHRKAPRMSSGGDISVVSCHFLRCQAAHCASATVLTVQRVRGTAQHAVHHPNETRHQLLSLLLHIERVNINVL